MRTVGKAAMIPESRLSKQIETNDNAAANEEEVEEQIEEDNVEKEARENGTGTSAPIMRSNQQMESDDNAVASREQMEEQAEENHIGKVAFEDGNQHAFSRRVHSERTHP